MFSACLGGILRDVTLGDPPILLSREVYVTATVLGGGTYVALAGLLGSASPVAVGAGIIAGFALRALAITRHLALPAHRGVDPA